MVDDCERQNWRKAFKLLGRETLRLQLVRNDFAGEYRDEAIKWLREEDDKADAIERRKYWTMLIVTGIAAIAALIAAWPVIKELTR